MYSIYKCVFHFSFASSPDELSHLFDKDVSMDPFFNKIRGDLEEELAPFPFGCREKNPVRLIHTPMTPKQTPTMAVTVLRSQEIFGNFLEPPFALVGAGLSVIGLGSPNLRTAKKSDTRRRRS